MAIRWPLSPNQVRVEDIARSLSMKARYNGFTRTFYSVAEHSVLLSRWLLEAKGELQKQDRKLLALALLLHDAEEAYTGDMPQPMKVYLRQHTDAYDRVCLEARAAVEARWPDLPHDSPTIKVLDTRILWNEKAALTGQEPEPWVLPPEGPLLGVVIHGWTPTVAELHFMQLYVELEGPRYEAG